MRVTAVIASHSRDSLLPRAAASAVAAGADEVIAVRYERGTAPPPLPRGVTMLPTRKPFSGGKYAAGIAQATGDVVMLLDDDDVLLPGKAERVRQSLSGEGEAANYYACREVAFRDQPPTASLPGPLRAFQVPQSLHYPLECPSPSPTSCIAARRSAVLPLLPDLRRLAVIDHALFLLLASQDSLLLMDDSAFTGRRVAEGERRSQWMPGHEDTAASDVTWLMDFLDRQRDAYVREAIAPFAVDAALHLIFASGTRTAPVRRVVKEMVRAGGPRRPHLVSSALAALHATTSPRLAHSLSRAWRRTVGGA